MLSIINLQYDQNIISNIKKWYYGENWPVVYIFYNERNAYVGETLDAVERTIQHGQEDNFSNFTNVCFISDRTFNKSVIIDLESFLIKYMSADINKKLTNANSGIVDHRYFYKEAYIEEFKEIWQKLIEMGIVSKTIRDIENSELYKYSPYKTLNKEQLNTTYEILTSLSEINNQYRSIIEVTGGAGTGKTILAIYLIKLIKDISENKKDLWMEVDDENYVYLKKLTNKIGNIKKIGFVVPMTQLNLSIKNVFNSIDGLSDSMVLTPSEVTNDFYDLLVVDEAHRLYKRKNLPNNLYEDFDSINKRMMGDKFSKSESDLTELDWIIQSSRIQILFYDKLQSIRFTDIGQERFEKITNQKLFSTIELYSQMRCKGGNGYYDYVKAILENSNMSIKEFKQINNYDIKVVDSVQELFDKILCLNNQFGLCKIMAGPGWSFQENIIIDGKTMKWVDQGKGNINQEQDDETVWSIHKIQGFDLNYGGVIFGKEIYYDEVNACVQVNRKEVGDKRAKPINDDEAMRRFVLNIYLTLMTRGIYGTYIYAENKELKNYLKNFFNY